eukprot:jgi/Tetstr1/465029/TSEL_009757.t1
MAATHFYLVTPLGADFFKYGITSDPQQRINCHLNTVGAAVVHVAPLNDPLEFEDSVGTMTACSGARRGTSETAHISARAAVLDRLRELRAPILEFHAVLGELAVPDAIPGVQRGHGDDEDEDSGPPMSCEDLKLLVKRGAPDDFVTCAALLAAVHDTGVDVSAVKLGRLMHKTFGLRSSAKRVHGKLAKGYSGVVAAEED